MRVLDPMASILGVGLFKLPNAIMVEVFVPVYGASPMTCLTEWLFEQISE